MMKKWSLITCTSLSIVALAACGNDEAGRDRYTDSAQPIGYYSTDEDGYFGNEPGEGPVTELIDNDSTGEKAYQGDDETVNQYGRNYYNHNDTYSNRDKNYHQHISMEKKNIRSSYYTAYEGELADRLTNKVAKVANVKDAHTVVYQDNVMIAVKINNAANESETKEKVEKAVASLVKGKDVQVFTQPSMFTKVRQVEYDLKDGGPMEAIENDLQDMVKTLRMN